MKKIVPSVMVLVLVVFGFSLMGLACKKQETVGITGNSLKDKAASIDSTMIVAFFVKYPKLQPYQKEVSELYQKYQYQFIWYDKKERKEIADVLYNKINTIGEEGVQTAVPYKETFDDLLQKDIEQPDADVELFFSAYYFFYAAKVLTGVDVEKAKELGWYLPRKKPNYVRYLDSILVEPKGIGRLEKPMIPQYYKLKDVLQKYRAIEKNGGWEPIIIGEDFKKIKPGDSSDIVAQIRTRLFLTGDIDTDSKNKMYGKALQDAVLKYKKRNGFSVDKIILPKHIEDMNIPISDRIKTIMVNMERCRWISTDITKDKEYIAINIPSYQLTYFKNGEVVLVSDVVVGNIMNKTVIFSGMMSSIVFCPYWNVPPSIIRNEIKPAMEKNKNYLAEHDMEWNNGNVRQKPGPNNSLGLVKFLFPNSNNIYLHDSPAKALFNEENRAFSHGCIRVAKPVELANIILEDDPNWSPEKISEAMHKGKETRYTLKNKIPVYIGYFTTWVKDDGTVNFYKDIYERDKSLTSLLLEE